MSSCCLSDSVAIIDGVCPNCGASCRRVENKTIFHQVKFPENQDLPEGDYFFCESRLCNIAYFSSNGHFFIKQQLRTLREIEDNKLCYCFDINEDYYLSILNDVNAAKKIKEFVIQRTKSKECACSVKNPSGQCCLAKFNALDNS